MMMIIIIVVSPKTIENCMKTIENCTKLQPVYYIRLTIVSP